MTATVTLEQIAPRHAKRVQRLASHPEIVSNTTLPEPYPEKGAEQWIERLRPRRKAGKEFAFAIINADSELVGVTGLDTVSVDEAELGLDEQVRQGRETLLEPGLRDRSGPKQTHEHPKWSENDSVVRDELNRAEWANA